MNHILIKKDNECYGCGACLNICPRQAITMVENKEGFLYPKVDKNKCTNCGLCIKTCPAINKISNKSNNPIYYAAKIKDKKIQKESTSGGIFSAIANWVIDQKGIVCGAEMDINHQVHHVEVRTKEDLKKLRGSKYVYSDLGSIFPIIEKNLISNKLVLFSGVPCQVAALKLFLKKDYDNLITIDVICHGTPNQKLFDKYIDFFEKKNKLKVLNYEFRSKKHVDWGYLVANVFCNKNGKFINKKTDSSFDWYYNSFLKSKNYRESCYSCIFATKERVSDFTLGDFWGINDVSSSFYDSNGVSAVILNTDKSQDIFDNILDNIKCISVSFKEMSKHNEQLKNPSNRPKNRDDWYNGFAKSNFIDKKYSKFIIKNSFKKIIPIKLKKYIKNYLNKV